MTAAGEPRRSSSREVEVGGIRLHYDDVGTGPVLLCTHGGGPGASAWGGLGPAIPHLASGLRLLLLDLPNFGGSQTGVRRGDEYPDSFLARLAGEFLDAVGVDGPVSFYTSSGGGPTALRFALDFPQRIRKLVIQAYAPGMLPKSDGPGRVATRNFLREPSHARMEELYAVMVPDPARRSATALAERWRAATVPGHLESRAEFATLAANSDLLTDLGRLRAEVLFVWGREDLIVPIERLVGALATVPRSRAAIWGGLTGHLVPHEHPREFAAVVGSFLREGTAEPAS